MNTVASETRLFRHLALTPYTWFQAGLCLLAAYISLVSEGWTYWVYPLFIVVFLLNIRVEWDNYRAVNLTRRHWNGHRRLLVSAVAGLVLLETALHVWLGGLRLNPVLMAAVPVAWGLAMARRPEPSRTLQEIVEGGESRESRGAVGETEVERSRFPLTPVQQIIRGPQTSMWIAMWAMAACAVAVSGVLGRLLGSSPPWLSVVVPLVAVPATWMIMGRIGESLQEWVALGGNRATWARETAVLGLLSPLIAGVLAVITGTVFSSSAFDALPLVLGVALLVPVLFTNFELTDLGRTWWVSLPHVCLGGGLAVLWATDLIGGGGFLIGSALIYLLHALTLPTVARNYTVFGGGLGAWLGLRSEAKA